VNRQTPTPIKVVNPTEYERFVSLGWSLIRHRLLYYYYPEYVEISDRKYDAYEKAYKRLAEQLGEPPTAIDGPEPDRKRYSVQMVEKAIKMDIELKILTKKG